MIYKSVSGVRSIVRRVERADLLAPRPDPLVPDPVPAPRRGHRHPRACRGRHRAGGARSSSDATDYPLRGARDTGVEPEIVACELDARIRAQCIGSPQRLRLPLAGIDLRRTPEGRHVCFEVNPSPAFSFYERRAGLPIAQCIARHLAGEAHWRIGMDACLTSYPSVLSGLPGYERGRTSGLSQPAT